MALIGLLCPVHVLASVSDNGSSSYWGRNEGEEQKLSGELGVLGMNMACESSKCKEMVLDLVVPLESENG